MRSLKERDGELIHNWYIACLSEDLKESPLKRTIYDEELVLFRDENKNPAAMVNRCLHRQSLLSEGNVIEGQLVCPYHSWHYDKLGNVTKVPSEGPGPLKGKRCNRAFPCVEKQGVIWVWMGEPENADESKVWDFPFMGEKGWTGYIMVTDFNNEVTNLVENFMDVPHTVSVHKGWFRNESTKKVPFTTETSNGKVLVTYDQPEDNIGVLIKPLLNPSGAPMEHTDCYVFPNITRVDYSFGDRYKYVINSQCTPVSTFKSRVYTYIGYRIPLIGPLVKPFIQYYTRQVIEQDVWIMDVQKENLKDNENPRFQSTPADEPHLQIERLRDLGVKGDSSIFEVKKSVQGEMWI
ncbi:MAG: aromatic ring-hydroxylating dioxygenase subunit alpha [Halobacteriovoraceae bacterium]|nr:aromatic ring-hydroxylating dioxygenase subunit alpha [Halobacteriovoraceae bacterium]